MLKKVYNEKNLKIIPEYREKKFDLYSRVSIVLV